MFWLKGEIKNTFNFYKRAHNTNLIINKNKNQTLNSNLPWQ
jgi:hypothetical protein